ncbi:hypothetical protein ABH926_002997 [Catenulispora sp. GP43]|uniref:MAB_1171c family putative transporter n=1 Tax=Catenulispora sp. GP43 TaxID=3156263 RepID=UPI003515A429
MSDIAAYLGAAVLVALAAWAFASERRGARRPIRRAGLAFVLCEGFSLALLAPGTVALSHAGVDGLSVIALGDTVRTAALSFLMLLACLLNPRPARRRSPLGQAALAVGLQTVMVLLFVAARPTLTPGGDVITGSGGRWPLAVRVALFAGYAIWALVEMFIALLPQTRLAATGPLRWGVRLVLAAIGIGVVWTLWSYDDIVHVLRYGRLDGSEDTVSNTLGALCATLVVAGSLAGRCSATFEAAVRWVRLCRCYVVMGPLWSALREAMPQIAFPEGGRPLLAGWPAGIEYALYRRVIEIHDGRLVLRTYHHPAVAAWLEDDSGAAAATDAALMEAATIATALENMRRGRRFTGAGERSARGAADGDPALIPTDLDAEVRWLSRVAWAFRRSPVIPELLERLRAEEGYGVASRG